MTKHESHVTRSSDASTFDEVCARCGATDIAGGGWGKLADPCPATEGGPQTDPYIATHKVKVTDELRARCAEILEWHKTGVLRGYVLRAYADKLRDKFGNVFDAEIGRANV